MSPTAQHILLIWPLAIFAIGFGRRVLMDWGKEEATLPIKLFGDTYQKDENYTMYTVAKSTNLVVFAVATGFIIYHVIAILFAR